MSEHDVVIIGGSAMGSAAAYHLGLLAPQLDVAVIERDPSYELCSTLRSDGNIRVQFNVDENIRMSQYTFELLDTFSDTMAVGDWRPDLAHRQQGNLFLADEAGRDAAMAGLATQARLGVASRWLDADEIQHRWPGYTPAPDAGIVGGAFGPMDGTVDSTALLEAFRRNAARLGATYVTGEASRVVVSDGRAVGVELTDGSRLDASVILSCTGAWAAPLAATAGVELPVEPVMRTVFVLDTPVDLTGHPSVFLPSGLYLFPDGTHAAQTGWSCDDDPHGFDFTVRRASFDDRVWPELAGTLPAFEQLRMTRGWCGVYAMNTFDQNAILGEWPTVPGMWFATGFSGHGLQHIPAMGRYLAERITGQPVTLDLSRLEASRIIAGTPVRENLSRII